ncbi:hypothetical protein ACWCQ0_05195 [Streptomyces massasporeus]
MGISKAYLYELIKTGQTPVWVLPLSGRHRVITSIAGAAVGRLLMRPTPAMLGSPTA